MKQPETSYIREVSWWLECPQCGHSESICTEYPPDVEEGGECITCDKCEKEFRVTEDFDDGR